MNEQINKVEGTARGEEAVGEHQVWRQDGAPWMPFDDKIDTEEKRIPPTEKEISDMDRSIAKLADIFAGTDIRWQLDGAMNISLMNGKYIGPHKDIDLSVEATDAGKLEELLEKNGYGLFLSERDGQKRVLRRIGHEALVKSNEHVMAEAVDVNGKITENGELRGMDIHLVRRDENGFPKNDSGLPVPKEWYEPVAIEYQGKWINASPAVKVLYYKMHSWRNYDRTDMDRLAETGMLTVDDLGQVGELLERDFENTNAKGLKVFEKISAELEDVATEEDFLKVLRTVQTLRDSMEFHGTNAFVEYSRKVIASKDMSPENLVVIAMEHFGIESFNEAKRNKLAVLKRKISDRQDLQKIRSEIGN